MSVIARIVFKPKNQIKMCFQVSKSHSSYISSIPAALFHAKYIAVLSEKWSIICVSPIPLLPSAMYIPQIVILQDCRPKSYCNWTHAFSKEFSIILDWWRVFPAVIRQLRHCRYCHYWLSINNFQEIFLLSFPSIITNFRWPPSYCLAQPVLQVMPMCLEAQVTVFPHPANTNASYPHRHI